MIFKLRNRTLKSNKTIEQKFNGISQGLSLYFGTTNGNFLFRAYEKYKETAHREKLDDASALLKYGIVNRFEMQLRQNYAEKVIEDLLFDNSLYQIAVNLLLSKIEVFEEIVQTDGTSIFNYCRAFYAIFGEYQIVKVNGKERTTAIEKSMRWIEMQVTPTLAVLVRLYGEEWLFNWLKMLIVRIEFSEKQQNLINMEQVLLDKGNQYSNSAYLYSVEAIERFEKKNL